MQSLLSYETNAWLLGEAEGKGAAKDDARTVVERCGLGVRVLFRGLFVGFKILGLGLSCFEVDSEGVIPMLNAGKFGIWRLVTTIHPVSASAEPIVETAISN